MEEIIIHLKIFVIIILLLCGGFAYITGTENRVELSDERVNPGEEKIKTYERDELTEKDKQLIKDVKQGGAIINENKYPMTRNVNVSGFPQDKDVVGFSQTRQFNIVSDNGEVIVISAFVSTIKLLIGLMMLILSPFAVLYIITIIRYTLWEIKWRYKNLVQN
jgi:hypothetical protein